VSRTSGPAQKQEQSRAEGHDPPTNDLQRCTSALREQLGSSMCFRLTRCASAAGPAEAAADPTLR